MKEKQMTSAGKSQHLNHAFKLSSIRPKDIMGMKEGYRNNDEFAFTLPSCVCNTRTIHTFPVSLGLHGRAFDVDTFDSFQIENHQGTKESIKMVHPSTLDRSIMTLNATLKGLNFDNDNVVKDYNHTNKDQQYDRSNKVAINEKEGRKDVNLDFIDSINGSTHIILNYLSIPIRDIERILYASEDLSLNWSLENIKIQLAHERIGNYMCPSLSKSFPIFALQEENVKSNRKIVISNEDDVRELQMIETNQFVADDEVFKINVELGLSQCADVELQTRLEELTFANTAFSMDIEKWKIKNENREEVCIFRHELQDLYSHQRDKDFFLEETTNIESNNLSKSVLEDLAMQIVNDEENLTQHNKIYNLIKAKIDIILNKIQRKEKNVGIQTIRYDLDDENYVENLRENLISYLTAKSHFKSKCKELLSHLVGDRNDFLNSIRIESDLIKVRNEISLIKMNVDVMNEEINNIKKGMKKSREKNEELWNDDQITDLRLQLLMCHSEKSQLETMLIDLLSQLKHNEDFFSNYAGLQSSFIDNKMTSDGMDKERKDDHYEIGQLEIELKNIQNNAENIQMDYVDAWNEMDLIKKEFEKRWCQIDELSGKVDILEMDVYDQYNLIHISYNKKEICVKDAKENHQEIEILQKGMIRSNKDTQHFRLIFKDAWDEIELIKNTFKKKWGKIDELREKIEVIESDVCKQYNSLRIISDNDSIDKKIELLADEIVNLQMEFKYNHKNDQTIQMNLVDAQNEMDVSKGELERTFCEKGELRENVDMCEPHVFDNHGPMKILEYINGDINSKIRLTKLIIDSGTMNEWILKEIMTRDVHLSSMKVSLCTLSEHSECDNVDFGEYLTRGRFIFEVNNYCAHELVTRDLLFILENIIKKLMIEYLLRLYGIELILEPNHFIGENNNALEYELKDVSPNMKEIETLIINLERATNPSIAKSSLDLDLVRSVLKNVSTKAWNCMVQRNYIVTNSLEKKETENLMFDHIFLLQFIMKNEIKDMDTIDMGISIHDQVNKIIHVSEISLQLDEIKKNIIGTINILPILKQLRMVNFLTDSHLINNTGFSITTPPHLFTTEENIQIEDLRVSKILLENKLNSQYSLDQVNTSMLELQSDLKVKKLMHQNRLEYMEDIQEPKCIVENEWKTWFLKKEDFINSQLGYNIMTEKCDSIDPEVHTEENTLFIEKEVEKKDEITTENLKMMEIIMELVSEIEMMNTIRNKSTLKSLELEDDKHNHTFLSQKDIVLNNLNKCSFKFSNERICEYIENTSYEYLSSIKVKNRDRTDNEILKRNQVVHQQDHIPKRHITESKHGFHSLKDDSEREGVLTASNSIISHPPDDKDNVIIALHEKLFESKKLIHFLENAVERLVCELKSVVETIDLEEKQVDTDEKECDYFRNQLHERDLELADMTGCKVSLQEELNVASMQLCSLIMFFLKYNTDEIVKSDFLVSNSISDLIRILSGLLNVDSTVVDEEIISLSLSDYPCIEDSFLRSFYFKDSKKYVDGNCKLGKNDNIFLSDIFHDEIYSFGLSSDIGNENGSFLESLNQMLSHSNTVIKGALQEIQVETENYEIERIFNRNSDDYHNIQSFRCRCDFLEEERNVFMNEIHKLLENSRIATIEELESKIIAIKRKTATAIVRGKHEAYKNLDIITKKMSNQYKRMNAFHMWKYYLVNHSSCKYRRPIS